MMDELRYTIQSRLGERMISMNSTLVETVSINYEDFNESFLTCGTCLCMYDGNEHTPKLLQCSHTVCLHCLTRIAASQTRDTGSFRCPICRELITIPRGGVSALPPSFLVNQLLDLMSRQRREVIPKCSVHSHQELLFCETCDTVFCTQCTDGAGHADTNTNGNSGGGGGNCEHTIIPFSIAIKRMSEILLYKANECIGKLSQAQEGVAGELDKLDASREECTRHIEETFARLNSLLEARKHELLETLTTTCVEKRKVLEEQHALIESEKNKVEQECQGLQYQVEVRNITQRIESLSEKLDAATSLGEPRENSFLACDFHTNNALELIEEQTNVLGRVRTSTTFPNLCKAQIEGGGTVVAGVESSVHLKTVDYRGDPRRTGGDPVRGELIPVSANIGDDLDAAIELSTDDNGDGTYDVRFRASKPGRYGVRITIFDRPVKDSPIYFDASEHNDPINVYGTKGSGKDEFVQPVAIAYDEEDKRVYVLDTGNSRIKILDDDFNFLQHVTNEALLGRSCTGMALCDDGIYVVNWRTRYVTLMGRDGETCRDFTYNAFQEPIDVAVDKSYGHVLVADNGMNCVYVFDGEGKILFQVGKKGTFNLISSVTVGPSGEIIVADHRIQVFSAKGDFVDVVCDEGKGKGRYGGIAVDSDGRILASRSEQKGKNYIHLLSITEKNLNNSIDSYNSKLKRPSGVAVTNDRHVIVVDLGNNCIKKYRYW